MQVGSSTELTRLYGEKLLLLTEASFILVRAKTFTVTIEKKKLKKRKAKIKKKTKNKLFNNKAKSPGRKAVHKKPPTPQKTPNLCLLAIFQLKNQ